MTTLDSAVLPHERLAVLAWCGFDCDGDIKAWLRSWLGEHPEEELEVHDIVSSTRADRGPKFVALVQSRLGFETLSERGAVVVRAVVAEICARVLSGELLPNELARAVRDLDANFIGLPGSALPYPDGLQHLWNDLDWCDEDWRLENQPHLREALERFVAAQRCCSSF